MVEKHGLQTSIGIGKARPIVWAHFGACEFARLLEFSPIPVCAKFVRHPTGHPVVVGKCAPCAIDLLAHHHILEPLLDRDARGAGRAVGQHLHIVVAVLRACNFRPCETVRHPRGYIHGAVIWRIRLRPRRWGAEHAIPDTHP